MKFDFTYIQNKYEVYTEIFNVYNLIFFKFENIIIKMLLNIFSHIDFHFKLKIIFFKYG
jgi:hypothetical protein